MRFANVLFHPEIGELGGLSLEAFEEIAERELNPAPEVEEPTVEEPEAEPAEEPEPALDEEPEDGQPRDDHGRFAPVEDEPDEAAGPDPHYLASIDETPESFAEMSEREQARTLAGQRQYQNVRKMSDAKDQELAERRRRDALEPDDDEFAEQEVERPYVDPTAARAQVADLVRDGNFKDAAILAHNAGGSSSPLYAKVISDWGDEHPGEATLFGIEVAKWEIQQAREAEDAPRREREVRLMQEAAWDKLEREHPQMTEQIAEAVQGGKLPKLLHRAISMAVATGDQGEIDEAYGYLQQWAENQSMKTNAAAKPAAEARQREADARLKQSATVATAEHTKPPTPKVELTKDERDAAELIAFAQREGNRADIGAGLTSG